MRLSRVSYLLAFVLGVIPMLYMFTAGQYVEMASMDEAPASVPEPYDYEAGFPDHGGDVHVPEEGEPYVQEEIEQVQEYLDAIKGNDEYLTASSGSPEPSLIEIVEKWLGVIGTVNTLALGWLGFWLNRKEKELPAVEETKYSMNLIDKVVDWILSYVNEELQAKLRLRRDPDWNLNEFSQAYLRYPEPNKSLIHAVQVLHRTNSETFPDDIEKEMDDEGLEIIGINPLHLIRGKFKNNIPEEMDYFSPNSKFYVYPEAWSEPELFDSLSEVVHNTHEDSDAIIFGLRFNKTDDEISTISFRFIRNVQAIPHTLEEWETFISRYRLEFDHLQENYSLEYVIVLYGIQGR